MCEHGMNTDQMKASLGQSQSTLSLVQEWLGQSAHVAGHADRADVVEAVARAQELIVQAHESLGQAIAELNLAPEDAVTVERV